MKEGWKMVKLGDVTSFQNGFAFKSSLFKDKGCPIIRISNIQDERLSTNGLVYFNPDDYNVDFNQYRILPNDILIAMSGGTTGKLGINQSDTVYYQNQRVGVIREKPELLYKQYLYYYLHTKTEESLKIAAGAAQPNLSTAQINAFEIPLPPLEEQHRIVSILDASFEKIDKLKANAEENLKNAKALFQQVLAQELKPKEGWVEKKLGEICSKIGSGATPQGGKKSYQEEGISLIRSLNVYDNEFVYKDLAFINEKQAEELDNVTIEQGDVLFNITGASVTRCCIVPDDILPARVNQHVSILRPCKDSVLNEFLCYLLIGMKDQLIKLAYSKGATRQAITKKQLEDLPIAYPRDMNAQQKVIMDIKTLSEKCRRLESIAQQTIRECDALKQSILRQAFSGEL